MKKENKKSSALKIVNILTAHKGLMMRGKKEGELGRKIKNKEVCELKGEV